MRIDDLFISNAQTASKELSSNVSPVPDVNSNDWEDYYKKELNFYSMWRFEAKYKRSNEVLVVNDYLRKTIVERILNFLSVYCPLHSEVRFQMDVNDKYIILNYDFFADFYYNIPGYMQFVAFIYRLGKHLEEKCASLNNEHWYNPYAFGYVIEKERNGEITPEYNYLFHVFHWGHILDTLIRCDTDDMNTKKWREDCRKVKFEVPGSALYDILTCEDSFWKTDVLSSYNCVKSFIEFYTRLFGDLSYSVMRDPVKQPENTSYITMHWLFRQINRNFKKCGKKPMLKALFDSVILG